MSNQQINYRESPSPLGGTRLVRDLGAPGQEEVLAYH